MYDLSKAVEQYQALRRSSRMALTSRLFSEQPCRTFWLNTVPAEKNWKTYSKMAFVGYANAFQPSWVLAAIKSASTILTWLVMG
jgi:hypothetical protein